MRHQVSKDLFTYWNSLKGSRAAPDRAHIDPAAIRHILADTFIIEVDAFGAYPLRYTGARIDALWQAEQRGESFIDLWQENHRRSVSAALMTVIDGTTPVVAGVRTRAAGDAQLDLELLLLPLHHFGKPQARVLGALSPAYPADWVGQLSAGPLEFLSMRVVSVPTGPAILGADGARPRPRLVVYNHSKQ